MLQITKITNNILFQYNKPGPRTPVAEGGHMIVLEIEIPPLFTDFSLNFTPLFVAKQGDFPS